MKKLLFWGVPSVALIALVAWRFVIQKQSDSSNHAQGGAKAPVVGVAPVASREMVQSIQSTGNVVSPFKVEISPKIAGRIDYLAAREGDSVTPGEIVLKIDPSDLKDAVLQQQAALDEARSRLAQAQLTSGATDVGISSQIRQQVAALNSAKANLDQVRSNYEAQVAEAAAQVTGAQNAVTSAEAAVAKENSTLKNVQSHLDRTTNLYSKGFLAAQDLDDARTAVDVQKGAVGVAEGQLAGARSQLKVQEQNLLIAKRKGQSDIAASEASLAQSKAALDVARANRSQSPAYRENVAALKSQVDAMAAQVGQAQARMRDTVVQSTISGTVTARKADPGGLATPGTPILEIQFLDWLYVSASLPIEAGAEVREGQSAEVIIDALPNAVFTGPIVNINRAADPQNRQFGIDVRLDNKQRLISPGMFAKVKIITGKVQAPVVVPREALVTDSSGNSTVTVVDDQNKAHVRQVKIGSRDDRGVQILDGVGSHDRVVVLTFNPIKDGQLVTLGAVGSKPGGKAPKDKARP